MVDRKIIDRKIGIETDRKPQKEFDRKINDRKQHLMMKKIVDRKISDSMNLDRKYAVEDAVEVDSKPSEVIDRKISDTRFKTSLIHCNPPSSEAGVKSWLGCSLSSQFSGGPLPLILQMTAWDLYGPNDDRSNCGWKWISDRKGNEISDRKTCDVKNLDRKVTNRGDRKSTCSGRSDKKRVISTKRRSLDKERQEADKESWKELVDRMRCSEKMIQKKIQLTKPVKKSVKAVAFGSSYVKKELKWGQKSPKSTEVKIPPHQENLEECTESYHPMKNQPKVKKIKFGLKPNKNGSVVKNPKKIKNTVKKPPNPGSENPLPPPPFKIET